MVLCLILTEIVDGLENVKQTRLIYSLHLIVLLDLKQLAVTSH
jgi:hypothetical protein